MPCYTVSLTLWYWVAKEVIFMPTLLTLFCTRCFSSFLSEKAEDHSSDGYPRHTKAEEQEHRPPQERWRRRTPGKAPVIFMCNDHPTYSGLTNLYSMLVESEIWRGVLFFSVLFVPLRSNHSTSVILSSNMALRFLLLIRLKEIKMSFLCRPWSICFFPPWDGRLSTSSCNAEWVHGRVAEFNRARWLAFLLSKENKYK